MYNSYNYIIESIATSFSHLPFSIYFYSLSYSSVEVIKCTDEVPIGVCLQRAKVIKTLVKWFLNLVTNWNHPGAFKNY